MNFVAILIARKTAMSPIDAMTARASTSDPALRK